MNRSLYRLNLAHTASLLRKSATLAILVPLIVVALAACGVPDALTVEQPATVATQAPAHTPTASPLAEPTPPAADSPLQTAVAPDSPLARPQTPTEPIYNYEVAADYPFDPSGFTQGLVYTDGVLYVGTGLYGQSAMRKTDVESGEILLNVPVDAQFFGEGVTVLDDKVYQLTWQENTGFVYNADDFSLLDTFSYSTEGWGLTHDGERLIMSDGTPTLYFRDPETLEETGRITVTSSLGLVPALNELEYVNGEIFANIWMTDLIARIDPKTGNVLGWINLTGLLGPEYRQGRTVDVLNGIAYDEENDRLFVTGKLWPRLFEIDLVPAQ